MSRSTLTCSSGRPTRQDVSTSMRPGTCRIRLLTSAAARLSRSKSSPSSSICTGAPGGPKVVVSKRILAPGIVRVAARSAATTCRSLRVRRVLSTRLTAMLATLVPWLVTPKLTAPAVDPTVVNMASISGCLASTSSTFDTTWLVVSRLVPAGVSILTENWP